MANTTKPVVVTVDDDAMPRIADVASQLGGAGLKVSQVMPLTGVITGRFAGQDLSVLMRVTGVMSVELEQGVQLAPPEADLQ